MVIIIFVFFFFYFKYKFKNFLQKYFNTGDLKEAIKKSEITASETPKSISSMEPILKEKLARDFPDTNINYFRKEAERLIIDSLKAIEDNSTEGLDYNYKIIAWINSKIKKNKKDNVHFNSIKFHQTSLSGYSKNGVVATIVFSSSLEYMLEKNGGVSEKVQDRYKVEFIYVIDVDKVSDDVKSLGLNCPNCGAPVKTLGAKYCTYCGTGITELVDRVWTLNNIKDY